MKNQSRDLRVILPNNTELTLTVGVKDRGQDVFNQLSELLCVSELHLFGLRVVNDDQPVFLDLEQRLSLYFPKSWRKTPSKVNAVLYLNVQFFVQNARFIGNSQARQLYYAELKGRVLRSECFEQEGLFFQLAAYALQTALGDYEEQNSAYFRPLDFFPFWIIQKRGSDYILEHTPALHRELRGMPSSKAAFLFMQEAVTLSDVPITIYRLCKEKNKPQYCVLMGLAPEGLQIFEILKGEKQFLCNLPWSDIQSLTFQGRKFVIRADGLWGKKLVFYSVSVLHAKNLLQHISNSHRLQMNMKTLDVQLKKDNGAHREMYITDGADQDVEDSDDELPPMKFLLDQMRNTIKGCDVSRAFGLEMSVDEPEEMFVDDPEDVKRLLELVEGVSVDDPLLLPVSQWKANSENPEQNVQISTVISKLFSPYTV